MPQAGALKHRAKRKAVAKPRRRRYGVRFLIHFAIALVLLYGLDRWLDRAMETMDQPSNLLTGGLFGATTLYHQIVTASPRKPTPRFTSLIVMNEESDPPNVSLRNVCYERRFVGDILKTLAQVQPRAVVIDKFFGASSCPADSSDTASLMDGMAALCDHHIRLIVGRRVKTEAAGAGDSSAALPLEPALSFGAHAGCVEEGIVNLDRDMRRVSLWWPGVQPVAGSTAAPPSIALAAATAVMPNLLQTGRLAGWTPDADPPYTSFLKPGQFDSFEAPARRLVCVADRAPGWRPCADAEIDGQLRDLIRGKVAVIGEDSQDDLYDTVVGKVSGYILQANYLESLLDDRLIRPVPAWVNVATGFVIFGLFTLLVREYRESDHAGGRLRAAAGLAVLIAGTGMVIYLAVVLAGYYLNPTTLSLLSAMAMISDMLLMPNESSGEGAA